MKSLANIKKELVLQLLIINLNKDKENEKKSFNLNDGCIRDKFNGAK